jgi:hypothetical protein
MQAQLFTVRRGVFVPSRRTFLFTVAGGFLGPRQPAWGHPPTVAEDSRRTGRQPRYPARMAQVRNARWASELRFHARRRSGAACAGSKRAPATIRRLPRRCSLISTRPDRRVAMEGYQPAGSGGSAEGSDFRRHRTSVPDLATFSRTLTIPSHRLRVGIPHSQSARSSGARRHPW